MKVLRTTSVVSLLGRSTLICCNAARSQVIPAVEHTWIDHIYVRPFTEELILEDRINAVEHIEPDGSRMEE